MSHWVFISPFLNSYPSVLLSPFPSHPTLHPFLSLLSLPFLLLSFLLPLSLVLPTPLSPSFLLSLLFYLPSLPPLSLPSSLPLTSLPPSLPCLSPSLIQSMSMSTVTATSVTNTSMQIVQVTLNMGKPLQDSRMSR